jgi:two-component system cell cycle sensor histidine kinase/response regulator CckA
LLIADVIAPGMSGPMLADKLTELQPGLPVLYISGYNHTQIVQKFVVEKGRALLIKPFNREQLRARVEELLLS